tara:strand:- start:9 stop:119 length:111 start_codon:yes stop_codon:yes gene_type:complete
VEGNQLPNLSRFSDARAGPRGQVVGVPGLRFICRHE